MLLLLAALAQPPVPLPADKPADKPPAKAPDAPAAKPADKPKPPPGPPEFEVQFTDGGNVRAVVLDAAVTVVTKFGRLEVPFAELRRVDFGFRYPPGVEAKVADAVGRLGAPAFRDREEAERELLAQKEYALGAVRRAAKSNDPEVARRADPLLRKLLAAVPDDCQQVPDQDTVETVEFTVRGRVELTGLKVRTRQFGAATLRVDEVRGVRALAAGGAAVEVALDAARFARQGWPEWLDTKLDVDADRGVEIVAGGSIDQWIQEPGRYMAGPNGTQAAAPGFPGQQPAGAGGPVMRDGLPGVPFRSGMVVGRVGPAGVAFPVGAEFKQPKAGVSGRLFLAIAPSNWNNDSVGKYTVKVKLAD